MLQTALGILPSVVLFACGAGSPTYHVGDIEFAGPPGSGEANLTTTNDGRVVLTWLESGAGDTSLLRYAIRAGNRWSKPRTIVARDDFFVNWADFPSLAVLHDGTWIVHWLQMAGSGSYAYHVELALSHDEGETWSGSFSPHRDATLTEHGFVSMVPRGDGVVILWLDGRQMRESGEANDHSLDMGDMSVRATFVDRDGVAGEDLVIDGRTCECCQTALARARAGVVAAYRDRSPEEIRDIAVSRLIDDAWTEPIHVADDEFHYPGCPVNGPQLAAHGDTVAIVWYAAPDQQARVQAAFSTDGGATWRPPIRLDAGDPLGRVDVEMLDDASALATWVERTADAAEIRARRVTLAGRADAPFTIAPIAESRASGFPRIIRVGDQLVVAWTAVGEGGGVRVVALK